MNHSYFINLNSEGLDRTFSGFKSRANLSWKVTEDALLYYTWSQGFRAGGFNRKQRRSEGNSPLAPGNNPWQAQATLHGGWEPPLNFAPDNLTNNELGWKTTWMGRRIQWDGAMYQENWDNVQIVGRSTSVFGTAVSPRSTVVTTGCAALKPRPWRASRPGSPSRRPPPGITPSWSSKRHFCGRTEHLSTSAR